MNSIGEIYSCSFCQQYFTVVKRSGDVFIISCFINTDIQGYINICIGDIEFVCILSIQRYFEFERTIFVNRNCCGCFTINFYISGIARTYRKFLITNEITIFVINITFNGCGINTVIKEVVAKSIGCYCVIFQDIFNVTKITTFNGNTLNSNTCYFNSRSGNVDSILTVYTVNRNQLCTSSDVSIIECITSMDCVDTTTSKCDSHFTAIRILRRIQGITAV